MASEDMFRSDTDDTTPDEIVIDGWTYTPSTITSVTEDRKTFDHLSQQMVGKLAEVTGCNDMVEARYNFILFCTKVVDTSQDELRQLREYFRNISEEPSPPASATASATPPPASPQVLAAASASTSATPPPASPQALAAASASTSATPPPASPQA